MPPLTTDQEPVPTDGVLPPSPAVVPSASTFATLTDFSTAVAAASLVSLFAGVIAVSVALVSWIASAAPGLAHPAVRAVFMALVYGALVATNLRGANWTALQHTWGWPQVYGGTLAGLGVTSRKPFEPMRRTFTAR